MYIGMISREKSAGCCIFYYINISTFFDIVGRCAFTFGFQKLLSKLLREIQFFDYIACDKKTCVDPLAITALLLHLENLVSIGKERCIHWEQAVFQLKGTFLLENNEYAH